MVATFPAPSAALLTTLAENGRLGRLSAAYIAESTIELADGSKVQMSRLAALKALRAIRQGLPAMPVAVSESVYQVNKPPFYTGLIGERNFTFVDADKEHAWRMEFDPRYAVTHHHPERFAPEAATGECPCGTQGRGLNYFSPDGLLRPTNTLFLCDGCVAENEARKA